MGIPAKLSGAIGYTIRLPDTVLHQVAHKFGAPLNEGWHKNQNLMKRFLAIALVSLFAHATFAVRIAVKGNASTVKDPATNTMVTSCSPSQDNCFVYYVRAVGSGGPGTVEIYANNLVKEEWSFTDVKIATTGSGATLTTVGTFTGAKQTR
jgi:PhoPQ-activated pathogenicity-related protein